MKRNITFIMIYILLAGIIGCAAQGPGRSTAQREEFHQQVNKDKKNHYTSTSFAIFQKY